MKVSPVGRARAASRVEPQDRRREPGSRQATHSRHSQDVDVELSAAAYRLRVDAALVRATLGGVEHEVSATGLAAFEAAGRSAYLASAVPAVDLSPEATAERILGGVRGYIYGAFLAQNPEATRADFERFASQVLRGFERGMAEARSIIAGLGMLDPELAADIDTTESLVREGLDAFFHSEAERYV